MRRVEHFFNILEIVFLFIEILFKTVLFKGGVLITYSFIHLFIMYTHTHRPGLLYVRAHTQNPKHLHFQRWS